MTVHLSLASKIPHCVILFCKVFRHFRGSCICCIHFYPVLCQSAFTSIVKMQCPSPASPCDVFDFGNPRTRELFIEECVNATQTGYVDGSFIDRAMDGTPTSSEMNATTAAAYFEGHLEVLKNLQKVRLCSDQNGVYRSFCEREVALDVLLRKVH